MNMKLCAGYAETCRSLTPAEQRGASFRRNLINQTQHPESIYDARANHGRGGTHRFKTWKIGLSDAAIHAVRSGFYDFADSVPVHLLAGSSEAAAAVVELETGGDTTGTDSSGTEGTDSNTAGSLKDRDADKSNSKSNDESVTGSSSSTETDNSSSTDNSKTDAHADAAATSTTYSPFDVVADAARTGGISSVLRRSMGEMRAVAARLRRDIDEEKKILEEKYRHLDEVDFRHVGRH